jgi:hypothetical protein
MPAPYGRRRIRPKAKMNLLVDGSVIRPGESVPRSVPIRDIDRLGRHGMVNRRPGDGHIGDSR